MIQLHLSKVEAEACGRIVDAVHSVRKLEPQSSLEPSDGWSSRKDFFTAETVSMLSEAGKLGGFDLSRVDVWANLLEGGQSIKSHDHRWSCVPGVSNRLSGVFYPQDSRAAIRFPDFGLRVEPRAGLLLLFDPTAPHSVEAAGGSEPRISIAFNVY